MSKLNNILGVKEPEVKYFDIKPVIRAGHFFNIVKAPAMIGKTFNTFRWLIDDALENGTQFIYLRRYKCEVSSCKRYILNAYQEGYNNKLSIKGYKIFYENKIIGYISSLNGIGNLMELNKIPIKTILFDEYDCIDMNRYLKNEVDLLINYFYWFRYIDRFIALSNELDQRNPIYKNQNIDINKLKPGKNITDSPWDICIYML